MTGQPAPAAGPHVDLGAMQRDWDRQASLVRVLLNSAWHSRESIDRENAIAAAWAAARNTPVADLWPAVLTLLPQLPARYAAIGAATRHLLNSNGYRRRHYDLLTGPWRRYIGRLHESDPDLGEPAAFAEAQLVRLPSHDQLDRPAAPAYT